MMTTRPSTQRDQQAEARRNQLLDIALALFAERGIENVTVKDLAKEAGIAQGLIYHYFKSKEELLGAVLQREIPLPEFREIIAQLYDLPVREGVMHFARHASALLSRKRPVVRLLVREILSPRSAMMPVVITLREEVLTLLAGYFEHRRAAGEHMIQQPIVAVHMLASSCITLILLDMPLEPLVPHFVAIVLNGIKTD